MRAKRAESIIPLIIIAIAFWAVMLWNGTCFADPGPWCHIKPCPDLFGGQTTCLDFRFGGWH